MSFSRSSFFLNFVWGPLADASHSQNPQQTAYSETLPEAYTETDEQGAYNVAWETYGETYAVSYVTTYSTSLGQAHDAANGQAVRSPY